jgi:hypothetical protein
MSLWVAKQHGHSAHLMLDVYANWLDGTDAPEIARIEHAIQRSPAIWHQHGTNAERLTQPPRSTENMWRRERDSNSESQSDQQVGDSESHPVPTDPRKSP